MAPITKYAIAPTDCEQDLGDPKRETTAGLLIAGGFFIGLLGWAAAVPLDAAAHAEGQISVEGNRRAVQHREGGVVRQLLVREGQRVSQGQVLIQLAAADVVAQERALSGQAILLLAQRARLMAEQAGSSVIDAPPEYATLFADRAGEAAAALNMQRHQLQTRAALVATQQEVAQQRAAQAGERSTGSQAQMGAAREQWRLISAELESLRGVAARGFVSQTRLRALERARAELQGQIGSYRAQAAEARDSGGEGRLQALEAVRSFDDRAATELREVQTGLGDLLPRLQAAREQLARAAIRAPVNGSVVGLAVTTIGGVVEPGQRLMEIVPDQQELLVEAKISPEDAGELTPGQGAHVRFPGLHDRNAPEVNGIVTRVSADRLTDEHTGQSYYTAEIAISASEARKLQTEFGRTFEFRPGTPASVLIPLRARTALQYLLDPLSAAMWSSMREH